MLLKLNMVKDLASISKKLENERWLTKDDVFLCAQVKIGQLFLRLESWCLINEQINLLTGHLIEHVFFMQSQHLLLVQRRLISIKQICTGLLALYNVFKAKNDRI